MTIRIQRSAFVQLLIILSIIIAPVTSCPAATSDTEKIIRQITPPIVVIEKPEAKDVVYLDSYYEPSDILQGSRTGHWSELTNTFAYGHGDVRSYIAISEFERFDNRDFTANIGTYITMKDSYAHLETAFGWMVDYMFRLQTIAEYGHKLYDGLYWQMGYNYRAYKTNDVHLVYPSLIYYFGDSYMSADFGASFVESRDTAYFGAFKGNFAITKFLRWWSGLAFGERLYDIYELDAREAYGYILFTGLTLDIYKGISARVGYLYGYERPKFIKRSLSFGLSIKF